MTNEQVKIIADAIKSAGSEISESISDVHYDLDAIKYEVKNIWQEGGTDTSDLGYIVQAITDFTKVFKEQCKIGGALNKPPYK